MHPVLPSFVLGCLQACKMLGLFLYPTSISLPLLLKGRRLLIVTVVSINERNFQCLLHLKQKSHVLSKTGKPALLSIIPEYGDAYLLDYKLLSPHYRLFLKQNAWGYLTMTCFKSAKQFSLNNKQNTLHVIRHTLKYGSVTELAE